MPKSTMRNRSLGPNQVMVGLSKNLPSEIKGDGDRTDPLELWPGQQALHGKDIALTESKLA